MRRTLPLIVLIAALAVPASAQAATAGHNTATKRLEAAFKVAQRERAASTDGCYLPTKRLASTLTASGIKAKTASGLGGVTRAGTVYVLKSKNACNQLRMSLIANGRKWLLNSNSGDIVAIGGGKGRDQAEPGAKGPLRSLSILSKSFRLTKVDQTIRGEVLCPRGKFPLGGGMTATPPPDGTGEGAYPHSYERLGAQRGFHANPVLIDPSVLTNPFNPGTTPRTVTLQVLCGKGLVPQSGPRRTTFLKSGQSGQAVARCPKGQFLMSGGFQRTNFKTPGGNHVTESRAISPKAWRVTGRAYGDFGGELTAIAYCDRSKRPLLSEVSAAAAVGAGQFATVTTPACPKRRRMATAGFTGGGSHDLFFAGSSINANNTMSVSAFGYFGAAPGFIGYGYCLRPGV